ncbi:hypothetical protein GCM10023211_02420 [Orbus sasakiae]|uniref:Uncharacterized protein n=1 Tax=Orbus sasakiae TaxID=1078475 RepID=A0ABP9N460_9GAMM
MSYGIKIFTKDSRGYHLDNNTTSMFMTAARYGDISEKTKIYIPKGYNYYAYLSDGCGFYDEIDNDSNMIVGSIESIAYLDENQHLCFKNGKHASYAGWGYDGRPVITKQQLIVLTWPENNTASGYGISMKGVNNFFSINGDSLFSNVIWKGDIEITNRGWSVAEINSNLSYQNSFVFFYCDDETISIGRSNRITERGDIILLPYDLDGFISNRSVKAKIVVFGNDKIKTSKYGMRIYNNKKIVYDSCNEILINPKFMEFSPHNVGQMVEVPGIKRPMFPKVTVGSKYFNDKSGGGYFCDIALRSNGRKVSTITQNTFKSAFLESDIPISSFVSEQQVMIIDAENYFNFD